jgi:hypothetical protein
MNSTTGSFMRYCTKLLSLLLLWLLTSLALADGIQVDKAQARQSEDGYQLAVEYGINLNFALQQALSRGIPLYFVSEFSLTRSRWYWLDEDIFHSEQTTKFSYNVLTRQYRISRGALYQNFASLDEALNTLARQSSGTIPMAMLGKANSYVAEVRLRLDTTQLPKLLQVNALTGRDWNLDSEAYRWVIRINGEGRPE